MGPLEAALGPSSEATKEPEQVCSCIGRQESTYQPQSQSTPWPQITKGGWGAGWPLGGPFLSLSFLPRPPPGQKI